MSNFGPYFQQIQLSPTPLVKQMLTIGSPLTGLVRYPLDPRFTVRTGQIKGGLPAREHYYELEHVEPEGAAEMELLPLVLHTVGSGTAAYLE